MMFVHCKAPNCGAAIEFVQDNHGKTVPINVETKLVYVKAKDGKYRLLRGHESHFATCTDPQAFRKDRDERKKAKVEKEKPIF